MDATILAPNGQIQVYDPLVINQGTTPAVAPVAPTIAAGSQVILSVGYNGNALALVGAGEDRATVSTRSATRSSTRRRSATRPTSTG